jgi:hypothetical protein
MINAAFMTVPSFIKRLEGAEQESATFVALETWKKERFGTGSAAAGVPTPCDPSFTAPAFEVCAAGGVAG